MDKQQYIFNYVENKYKNKFKKINIIKKLKNKLLIFYKSDLQEYIYFYRDKNIVICFDNLYHIYGFNLQHGDIQSVLYVFHKNIFEYLRNIKNIYWFEHFFKCDIYDLSIQQINNFIDFFANESLLIYDK